MRDPDPPTMHCPRCGDEVQYTLSHGGEYTCPLCRAQYAILLDEKTGEAAFVEPARPSAGEPLGLPKGSIRAAIALGLLGTATLLGVAGREVPDELLSLLLTVIGFYFGFRTTASALSDRVYDPFAAREQPLYMPGGVIRKLMIAAVIVLGFALGARGVLWQDPTYAEFFFTIAGLIAGHLFGRYLAGEPGSAQRKVIGHVKAMACLCVAALLVALFLTDTHRTLPTTVVLLLCATVSFYYGSRT
jgi:hypothetical protein